MDVGYVHVDLRCSWSVAGAFVKPEVSGRRAFRGGLCVRLESSPEQMVRLPWFHGRAGVPQVCRTLSRRFRHQFRGIPCVQGLSPRWKDAERARCCQRSLNWTDGAEIYILVTRKNLHLERLKDAGSKTLCARFSQACISKGTQMLGR